MKDQSAPVVLQALGEVYSNSLVPHLQKWHVFESWQVEDENDDEPEAEPWTRKIDQIQMKPVQGL